MARTSNLKRAKTTATVSPEDADSGSVSVQPQLFIPFQTGPSLECIPDDVLHEILSHLPTLSGAHVSFGHCLDPPVIPSASLVRTPTLRALSQTSRLLRSRCLAMAWRRVELCGVSIPKHNFTFYKAIGEATKTAVRVLKACPHLLPLIQTVSVVLIRFQSAEIIPAFAACLASLPNLTTIQVIHAHSKMTTAIKNGFEGKRFPSVRRIALPRSAHEIIKSCPNLEEVTCTEGDGGTIVGSLVKGDCRQVRVLRGISAPLTRMLHRYQRMTHAVWMTTSSTGLVKLVPNLKHISVAVDKDTKPLANFPLLDTIEIVVDYTYRQDFPLSEFAPSQVREASKILKENKSQAEKTVLLTKWNDATFELDLGYMVREVIKV